MAKYKYQDCKKKKKVGKITGKKEPNRNETKKNEDREYEEKKKMEIFGKKQQGRANTARAGQVGDVYCFSLDIIGFLIIHTLSFHFLCKIS